MQKHIEPPVHRRGRRDLADEKQGGWPLTAREFMKLPVSGLMSAGERFTFLVKREVSAATRGRGDIRP